MRRDASVVHEAAVTQLVDDLLRNADGVQSDELTATPRDDLHDACDERVVLVADDDQRPGRTRSGSGASSRNEKT